MPAAPGAERSQHAATEDPAHNGSHHPVQDVLELREARDRVDSAAQAPVPPVLLLGLREDSASASLEEPCPLASGRVGGADGVRTRDLVNAIHARSQLRHSPTFWSTQQAEISREIMNNRNKSVVMLTLPLSSSQGRLPVLDKQQVPPYHDAPGPGHHRRGPFFWNTSEWEIS